MFLLKKHRPLRFYSAPRPQKISCNGSDPAAHLMSYEIPPEFFMICAAKNGSVASV
jgi:hypothetical protein